MGLTNLSPALGRFLLLSVSPKLTTQSRFRPFPQTYFSWPPSLLCSLDSIFSFIIGALAWFFQITFSPLRRFARICSWLCTFLSFHQQSSCFSAFFRQLFSLCWRFCHLVLLTLSSCSCWQHKQLWFDWSAGLSTGIFLSTRANVRLLFSKWIPTKLTSSSTSSYSTHPSASIPLQLSLGSPSTPLFHVSLLKAKFCLRLKVLRCFCFLMGPL